MNHLKASIGSHEVEGSQIVQETLSAERTVTSFGLEHHFYQKFLERSTSSSLWVLPFSISKVI